MYTYEKGEPALSAHESTTCTQDYIIDFTGSPGAPFTSMYPMLAGPLESPGLI